MKIGVLEIIWKLKSWKLNLKIGNYLKFKVLKIIWKLRVLKIKFQKLEFWKLFENWSFLKLIFESMNGELGNKWGHWVKGSPKGGHAWL